MLQSKSRTWVEIDLNKLEHNFNIVKELLGTTKMIGVVKANAYGHGDIQVAKKLASLGVDFFAVACIDEAIHLRENGINGNILILGYTPEEHFHYLAEQNITQCIMSCEYAHKLNEYAIKNDVTIKGHIKVDTGMSRLGIQAKEDNYCIEDIKKCFTYSHVNITGIFSHFSVSDSIQDEDDLAYTDMQINMFNRVLKDLDEAHIDYGMTHMNNSYGCVNYNDLPYDYARPGIIFLGSLSNDQDVLKYDIDLQPVLSWKANISLVKNIKKGCNVSYGRHFKADKDMKVATVSCGYADGMNRAASNKGQEVLINGQRCPIIGNICMDQFIVDVSHVENVHEGDVVTIIGSDGDEIIKIDEMSRICNTINNESFTRLTYRVPRFYIGE